MEEIFKTGQWLFFKKGTCFGSKKHHLGIIVAISNERSVCLAISATSNLEGVIHFADERGIDLKQTIVTIGKDDPKGSGHFTKPTAFDCNRPEVVDNLDMQNWIKDEKIVLAHGDTEVNTELFNAIKEHILNSPMVTNRDKNIIRYN